MQDPAKGKPASRGYNKAAWTTVAAGAAIAILATVLILIDGPRIRTDADVVVYKHPHCGCCARWISLLEDSELDVQAINVANTHGVRKNLGVPAAARSCHTAAVGDYWVEGHVPVDLVRRLLEEKPKGIRGLSVPGMVVGSPGMEGPDAIDYDVIAYTEDGNSFVYESRRGKEYPQ